MAFNFCDPDWIQTNDLPDLKSGCSIPKKATFGLKMAFNFCDPDWIQTNDLPDLKSGCSIPKKATLGLKMAFNFCDPDWIQTNDLLLRRQLLYSTELPDQRENWPQR